jgi:hypothetical protein
MTAFTATCTCFFLACWVPSLTATVCARCFWPTRGTRSSLAGASLGTANGHVWLRFLARSALLRRSERVLLEYGQFLRRQFTPLACLQSFELQWSHAHAPQFLYWMSNGGKNLAHLAIAIFTQLHVEKCARRITLQNHQL